MTAVGVEQKIQHLNCTMKSFIEELKYFRLKHNVVNSNLVQNIFQVLEEVHQFLEGNPEKIQGSSKDLDFNFLQFQNNGLYCSLCETNFVNDVLLHVIGKQHETKLKELSSHQQIKEKIQKIENKLNKTAADDTESPIERTEATAAAVPRKAFSQAEIKNLHIQRIFRTGESFKNYIDSMLKETNNVLLYLDFVEKFQKNFKDFRLYLCGPLAFGLQNFYSPQEVFVDTGDAFYAYPSKTVEDIKNNIKAIIKILSVDQHGLKEWEYSIEDKSGSSPILQLYYRKQQIRCTLTFANGLPYCKALLVKNMISLNTLYSKTCIALQKIVKDYGLNEYFDPYIIVLLVIFYYQTRYLLPPIYLLQEKIDSAYNMGPWQVNYGQNPPKVFELKNRSIASKDHSNHIRKCLRYLANHIITDNKITIMSPFLGPIDDATKNFHNYLLQNPLTKRYSNFCKSASTNEHLETSSALCLQDPIELNKNITAQIPINAIKYFQAILKIIIQ